MVPHARARAQVKGSAKWHAREAASWNILGPPSLPAPGVETANIFRIPLHPGCRHIRRVRARQRRPAPLAGALAFVVGAAACGGTPAAPTQPVLSFGDAPAQSTTSRSGALRIDVRWSPTVPVVGLDAAQLVLTYPPGSAMAGAPADGIELSVVPWMPAHGHGSSVVPEVESTSPGVFVASPISIFMTGGWELRLTMTGAVADTATASFDVRQ